MFRLIDEHQGQWPVVRVLCDALHVSPGATTPGATALPAPASNGTMPSGWRSG
jgi:hypothetical protein